MLFRCLIVLAMGSVWIHGLYAQSDSSAREEKPPAETKQQPGVPPDSLQTGSLVVGSTNADAFLYLNGVIQGPARLRMYTLPAGYVRLEIRADGCDSYRDVLLIRPKETRRIGRREPVCPSADSDRP